MYRKSSIHLAFLVLAACLPTGSSAAVWIGAGVGDSWCTPENWDKSVVPGSAEIARINPPPERGPVVNCNVNVGFIEGPKWSSNSNQVMDVITGTVVINGQWRFANGGTGTATVNISGNPDININGVWRASDRGSDYAIFNISDGTIYCLGFQIGDDGSGELNMSGGSLYVDGDMQLGGVRGSAEITVNMTGGLITVSSALKAPPAPDILAGEITINLYGGTIECGAFTHAEASYAMDVTEGTMTITGDVRGYIYNDIASGYITAYGGEGTVNVALVASNTMITASPPDPNRATNPNPAHEQAVFDPEVTLSWSPAINAAWHDVYLGTDFNDVSEATDPNVAPGRSRQDANSYDPCGLETGKTYYWRIDEVNGPDIWRGHVWQFMVVDGLINSIGMEFVRVQPGTFQMGSNKGEWDERPVHTVTISQPFCIQIAEVTADQYRLFDANYAGTEYATGLSWHYANAFCKWLSDLEGRQYRLPTEAEWEYACRAGTTTPYSSGGGPPPPGTANPWGIINMHNSPREWVWDWHGEYPYEDQVDPVGPEHGLARVVRGGGMDNNADYYFRSSNRSGIAPGFGGGSHNIGIRLVSGQFPATIPEPYQAPFTRQCVKQGGGYVLRGPDPCVPYFNQRPMLPTPPEHKASRSVIESAGFHPSFRGHNHSPGMEVCPNGDVLLIIYTSYSEYEPGVSLMAARLRFGSLQWDMPTPMFDFPGANDHAPMLWNDNGVLYLFWGCPRLEPENSNPYPFQWVTSPDSGATWTEVKFPEFVGSIGEHSRQPINSALRDGNTIYVSSDGRGGSSVLWKSDDNGLTWYDPGGRTYGRHTTFVFLNNGDILGMGGKNTQYNGTKYMPKSISSNGAVSWTESGTPFSYLNGNQRPCVIRLASGRLFFCSDFQHRPDCDQPSGITKYGSLVALSDDEGQTWTIKKIPTALPHECLCWACGNVGTLGYSVTRQAANGIIHVITTMNRPCQHFEFNEAWILDPNAGPNLPPDPGTSGTVNDYQENYPGGATKATWSAKTCDNGRYLMHGTETWYYQDGQKQYEVAWYNGHKVGAETYWGSDGVKQWEWDHDELNDTSIWTQFWPNGLKRAESSWRYGGMFAHGDSYFWDMYGTPQEAWNFSDGLRTGSAPLPPAQVKDADLNLKANQGRTPLWYAQDEVHTEIIELLKKHGAKE